VTDGRTGDSIWCAKHIMLSRAKNASECTKTHQCENNFQKNSGRRPSADSIVPHVSILSYTLFSPFRRLCRPQRAVHTHAVNTVIRTTLVGLEPTTFRSLVRRATSGATEPTIVINPIVQHIAQWWVGYDRCVHIFIAPAKQAFAGVTRRILQSQIIHRPISLRNSVSA